MNQPQSCKFCQESQELLIPVLYQDDPYYVCYDCYEQNQQEFSIEQHYTVSKKNKISRCKKYLADFSLKGKQQENLLMYLIAFQNNKIKQCIRNCITQFVESDQIKIINESIDNDKNSLFMLCCYHLPDMALLMFNKNPKDCRVELRDKFNFDSLMLSILHNQFELIQQLIKYDKNLLKQLSSDKETPLMIASQDYPQIALQIISFGIEYSNPSQVNRQRQTALIIACFHKEQLIAESLIQLGQICNPQQIDTINNTALIIACQNKLNNVAISLIKKFGPQQCVTQHVDFQGKTALIIACENNLVDVALCLIKLGPQHCYPQKIDCNNQTAFSIAMQNDMDIVVEQLLKLGTNYCIPFLKKYNIQLLQCQKQKCFNCQSYVDLIPFNDFKYSCIHCYKQDFENKQDFEILFDMIDIDVLNMLVSQQNPHINYQIKKAIVQDQFNGIFNKQDSDGNTFLMQLTRYDPFIVQLIINRTQVLKQISSNNQQPYIQNIIKQFCNDDINFVKQLQKAAILSQIFRYNLDLKLKNNQGMTILMTAIKFNHEQLAIDLITQDNYLIDINQLNGSSTLYLACLQKQHQVVKQIIRSNIPEQTIQYIDSHHKNIFNILSEDEQQEIFITIFNYALRNNIIIHINQQCDQGYTPLMQACKHGLIDIVKLILQQSDQLKYNIYGETALILACKFNHPEIIFLLLENNSDYQLLQQKTSDNKTALQLAIQHNLIDIIYMISD